MPKDREDPLPPGPPLSSARRCRPPAIVVCPPLSSACHCRLPASPFKSRALAQQSLSQPRLGQALGSILMLGQPPQLPPWLAPGVVPRCH